MAAAEYDVVVVGYGGAGGSAAIAASDAGARVLLVEKMSEGGGSTHEAGGTLRPSFDVQQAAVHYRALSGDTTPLDVMETFAEAEQRVPERIAELGGTLGTFTLPSAPWPHRRDDTAYPHVAGAEGLGERTRVAPEYSGQGGGEALWNLLASNVEKRDIDVAFARRGIRLGRDVDGRTRSIDLADEVGAHETVRVKGGVVLSCGGFAHDSDLKRDALGIDIGALSPPGRNTGDGIRIANAVGAGLWHMNAVSCTFGYRFPGQISGFYAQMPANGYFIVDQTGRRFCDESEIENHSAFNLLSVRNPASGLFERIPAYIVFDDRTRTAGTIFNPKTGYNRHYPWSPDNSAEIESGWITQAASMGDLADKLGLPREEFVRSAEEYGRSATGTPDPFGRVVADMEPLDTAPFYGLALWPCLLNTQGGPRRDRHARVLDGLGQPIAGLFSAGELGSIWGPLYPGSGNVAEALVFGEIAGRNAAEGVG